MIALIFADPAFVNFVDRHGVQIVQLLAPLPDHGHQVGVFQQTQMLRHRLAGHVQLPAQFAERLPALTVQFIEQLAAALIRQGFEHVIHDEIHYATKWLHVKRGILRTSLISKKPKIIQLFQRQHDRPEAALKKAWLNEFDWRLPRLG